MKLGVVSASIASLYLEANKESELVDETFHGTDVSIIGEEEGFYKIKTFYKYQGYIDKTYVEICKSKINNWNNKSKLVVKGSYTDIKVDTKVRSRVIESLPKGALVGICDKGLINGYYKVYLVNGREGYIRKEFLTTYIQPTTTPSGLDEESIRHNIVNNAISYLGTQYKWGGKTSLGIDCSGLCFMSYLLEGIVIFRDAKIKNGFSIKEVDIGIIKEGDLIFFKEHVGLYIGKGEYIHSSYKNNGVFINSLLSHAENYSSELHNSIISVGSIF